MIFNFIRLYFESRRLDERECVSFEGKDVVIKLDLGDGNDDTNCKIESIDCFL
jgi:hypothetical protein